MHTRVKYVFEGNGPIGYSKQYFKITGGKQVQVWIDKQNFTFQVQDQDGNVLEIGGNTKNYAVLLRQAKRAVKNLGYDFGDEERNRDYGLVKKGKAKKGKRKYA